MAEVTKPTKEMNTLVDALLMNTPLMSALLDMPLNTIKYNKILTRVDALEYCCKNEESDIVKLLNDNSTFTHFHSFTFTDEREKEHTILVPCNDKGVCNKRNFLMQFFTGEMICLYNAKAIPDLSITCRINGVVDMVIKQGNGDYRIQLFSNGDVYEGCWVEGKRHGFGKCTGANGDVYEGCWVEGKRHGFGKCTGANGEVYEGYWDSGKLVDAKGKFIDVNGDVYEGCLKNGQRDGKGKFTGANGEVYEGYWDSGKLVDAKGKFIYPNRYEYEGCLKNGQRDGKGKCIYAHGDVCEGCWVEGKRHGFGKYIYANGEVYEGYWRNGQREGMGKYIYANGGVYEGYWYNGQREGMGKYIYANGGVYEGFWYNGQRDGRGKCTLSDGDVYEGNFANDSLDEGTVTTKTRDGDNTTIRKTTYDDCNHGIKTKQEITTWNKKTGDRETETFNWEAGGWKQVGEVVEDNAFGKTRESLYRHRSNMRIKFNNTEESPQSAVELTHNPAGAVLQWLEMCDLNKFLHALKPPKVTLQQGGKEKKL